MAEANQSAQVKSGETISVACNLPHGLTIDHKGKSITLAGANHPKAIATTTAVSGQWGITHNVDKAWLDDWMRTAKHPAVANGNIMPTAANKAVDMVEELGAEISTGVDALDPEKPGPGVEPVKDEE